jgi:hypothetical protein
MSLQRVLKRLALLLAVGVGFQAGSVIGTADDARSSPYCSGAVYPAGFDSAAPPFHTASVGTPGKLADPTDTSPAPATPRAPSLPCASGCAAGGCGSQDGHCRCGLWCPPPLVHCTPKPPKVKFKWVCGKPVCNPCDLVGYGYNPTCWRPGMPPLNCPNMLAPPYKDGVPAVTAAGQPPLVGSTKLPQPLPVDVVPSSEKQPDDMLPPIDR